MTNNRKSDTKGEKGGDFQGSGTSSGNKGVSGRGDGGTHGQFQPANGEGIPDSEGSSEGIYCRGHGACQDITSGTAAIFPYGNDAPHLSQISSVCQC